MPFQLSTQMYGGGGDGGGSRSASPFGQLGALMELQMRRENLESQKAQRELINEQRQQAIDKVEAARQRDVRLNTLFETNPNPTLQELVPILGTDAPTFHDNFGKAMNTANTNKKERISSGVKAIYDAYKSEEGRAGAWDTFQKVLVRDRVITPEETGPYSPELLREYYLKALTPTQQAEIINTEKRTEIDAATEARNKAEHDATLPGKRADAQVKARAEAVQRLGAARTAEAYEKQWADTPADIRDELPTVADWVRDKRGTLSALNDLGLTPEQKASKDDRDKTRAMTERHFQQQEGRLAKQYGEGVLTSQMYQTATRRRADDEQRLAERISDAKRNNKPMSQSEIDDERLRIAQAHDAELRLPPSLQLADARKKTQLDALEAEFKDRNATIKVEGSPDESPRNPMTVEELNDRKKAIQNTYRSWLGMEPGGASQGAPTPTPRPQTGPPRPLFGGAPPPAAAGPAPGPRPMFGGGPPPPPAGSGMLGDLMTPPPPQLPQFGPGSAPLAGPPRGAPPAPPTADPAVMRQVADIEAKIRDINNQIAAPGQKDIMALKRQFDALAAQRKQLIGK